MPPRLRSTSDGYVCVLLSNVPPREVGVGHRRSERHAKEHFGFVTSVRINNDIETAGYNGSADNGRVDEAKVCPGGAGKRDEGRRRADEAGQVGAPGRRSG